MSLTYPHPYFWEKEQQTAIDVAGNVVTNITPGAGYRWIVLSIVVKLTADATVQNRYLAVEKTDGTVVTDHLGVSSTAITANQVKSICLGALRNPDKNWDQKDVQSTNVGYSGLDPFILDGADTLRITVTTGQAGDKYTYWVEVLKIRR